MDIQVFQYKNFERIDAVVNNYKFSDNKIKIFYFEKFNNLKEKKIVICDHIKFEEYVFICVIETKKYIDNFFTTEMQSNIVKYSNTKLSDPITFIINEIINSPLKEYITQYEDDEQLLNDFFSLRFYSESTTTQLSNNILSPKKFIDFSFVIQIFLYKNLFLILQKIEKQNSISFKEKINNLIKQFDEKNKDFEKYYLRLLNEFKEIINDKA